MREPTPFLTTVKSRYLLGLSLIAALTLASYFMLRTVMARHHSTAAVLNYAGKRRYLSQMLALQSVSLVTRSRVFDGNQLRQTIDRLQNTHEGLLNGNSELGLPGNPSPELKRFYFEPPVRLDAMIREYLNLGRTWLQLPDSERRADHPVLLRILDLGPGQLLRRLDEAVEIQQRETERGMDQLQALELAVLMATLLLLALELVTIFQPMLRGISLSLQRLDDERRFYSSILDAIPDPIFVRDQDYRWVLVNQTFCDVLGKHCDELLGKTAYDYFPKPTAEAYRETDRTVLETGQGSETVETVRDARGRDRTMLSKKVRTKDLSGHWVLIGSLRDITEHREAEQSLQVARFQAFQTAKLASMGELAASIAHEINSPLAVISVRIAMLQRHLAKSTDALDSIEFQASLLKVAEMIKRITRIIQGLQSLARHDSQDQLEEATLPGLITDALEICHSRMERQNIQVEIDPGVDDVLLYCRPGQVLQVLVNLFTNAIDAVSPLVDRWVHVAAAQHDRFIEISVTDSGPGIPPELREKILQPFFTTKPLGKGTGLGLSLSRKLLEGQGGSLELDANASNTRFVIRLPHDPARVLDDLSELTL